MIAYNKEWLDHLTNRRAADKAFDEDCLTKEERESIYKRYFVGFYTPNVFVRIGLLLLTIIVQLFSFGLIALIFRESNENTFGVLAIVFALMCYIALEYMIKKKHHYSSGVDEGLLWGASLALFCGISLPHVESELTNSIIVFIISLFGCIRYADRLMAVVLYISSLAIIFYSCIEMGSAVKSIVPFVIMIVSLVAYFLVLKFKNTAINLHYANCLIMIEIASLISLYAAGNYFIVRELSNELFHLNLHEGESIPFGWLFWIFTVLIPLLYLVRGVMKKNIILIRTGLLLIVAIVCTIRHYHIILPIETLMTIVGTLILIIAYYLMKWLQEPVNGFTSRMLSSKNEMEKLQLESLIIAQTFKPGTEADGTKFGGGDFGGGGASGDY